MHTQLSNTRAALSQLKPRFGAYSTDSESTAFGVSLWQRKLWWNSPDSVALMRQTVAEDSSTADQGKVQSESSLSFLFGAAAPFTVLATC